MSEGGCVIISASLFLVCIFLAISIFGGDVIDRFRKKKRRIIQEVKK